MSQAQTPAIDAATRRYHPPVSRWLRDRRFRKYWVTALFAAAAILSAAVPTLPTLLEYDRDRLPEFWRFFTCHIAHFDAKHLFWSGSAFVAFAAWLEPLGRRRLLACIAATAVTIPIFVLMIAPDLPTYRGLSGIDSALFTLALVLFAREARSESRRGTVAFCILLGIGFAAKLIYEIATGAAVFADSAVFEPVPLAHAVGAAVGGATGICSRRGAPETVNDQVGSS